MPQLSYTVWRSATSGGTATQIGTVTAPTATFDDTSHPLPICDLTAKPNAYVVYAESKCTDPNGKVIGYPWQVNGQPIVSTSYRISFSKTGTPQSANVTITAMDDAKELSIPVSINIDY